MNNNDSQLVIRDTPMALWIVGVIFAGVGAFFFFLSRGEGYFLLIFFAIGLSILLFSSALTITADKLTRTLTLDYRSLLRHNIKEIPFDEIASISVQHSTSRRKGRTRHSYRVAATLKDGQVVPFRSYYSSGSGSKEQQASQLRAFIGVEGLDETISAIPKMAQAVFQSQQQALTGDPAKIRETNGVHWQAQSVAMGAAPVTRWFSPDFKTPDSFLFLAQKTASQGSSAGGGFLASLGSMLFKQSISMYGFRPDDTPGLDQAIALTPLDPSIEPHFIAFTSSDTLSARQTLNPWAVMPLADWGRRHPLQQFQSGTGFSQLVVLFSPNGVYLATLNLLQPDQLDELSALGVELVKSQGSSSSAF